MSSTRGSASRRTKLVRPSPLLASSLMPSRKGRHEPARSFFCPLSDDHPNPKKIPKTVGTLSVASSLPRGRVTDKSPGQPPNLADAGGPGWCVRTGQIGLITRRSCLQIPFSMIRLACTRLRRHPSARFIDGAVIASYSRRADGASSGSQRFPEGRGGVSVPFR